MNKRFFIDISFNGKAYHGWQVQPGTSTIQETLGKCISLLLNEDILPTGAGRTDAGVHARNYIAHFNSSNLCNVVMKDFIHKLNRFLPTDIVVHKIFEVKSECHARFTALNRSYEYIVSNQKDVFNNELHWYCHHKLNVEAMNAACGLLVHQTDFTSFSKLHSDNRTNICHLMDAVWIDDGVKLVFRIKADRFLRNMVRALVGTMVEIGRGKLLPEQIITIADQKDRSKAGFSAPAQGLCFTGAEYPKDIFVHV